MSSLGSPSTLFLAKKEAYTVERSLRFNRASGDMTLDRTPSNSGNQKTWTFSAWIKRASLSANYHMIFEGKQNGSNYTAIYFDNTDKLRIEGYAGSEIHHLKTSQVFRDVSSWQHLVVAFDTTQGTASNRIKLYVNGTQVTDFDTENYPSQDYDTFVNSTQRHDIGRGQAGNSQAYGGYMAEINLTDGQQYDPSYFGATDVLTGQWNPKKYGGGYGTNGFYLNFSDNSGTSATTLGKDSSGNGNNFTPNNFSVSAGAGNDSLEDTPTNNFTTINSIFKADGFDGTRTLSEGNLAISGSTNDSSGDFMRAATIPFPLTGKWYVEANVTTLSSSGGNDGGPLIGITDIPYNHADPKAKVIRADGKVATTGNAGGAGNSQFTTSFGGSISQGDVWQLAYDADNRYVYFGKNNNWANGSGSYNQSDFSNAQAYATQPTAGIQQVYIFTSPYSSASGVSYQFDFNFGQRAFAHTPPTGYEELKSANLPDPAITLPNQHFDTLLFTANASTQVVTGLNFKPDWVWGKSRSDSYDHELYDTVRGPLLRIKSNSTDQELTNSQNLQSFNSDGFTLGSQTNMNYNSGSNIVAWNWNAGETDGKTYTVTVVSDSGNKYRFDGYGTSAVTLDLAEGGTYIFDQSDSSNAGHPLRFSTTANGTHGGGSEYTTGVTTAGTPGSSGAYTQIVVAASAPTLYYYCSVHSGMGGQANTNSTLGSSNFDGSIQSTVKVNATAGFSIGTWVSDGSGSPTSFGHGLGVRPDFVIIKNRSSSGNWQAWSYTFSNATNNFISLNLETGTQTAGAAMWGTIDSSIVSFRHSANSSNGNNMVGYFFNSVDGYSKFGSYRGNGNTDGVFVYTGFRPAWVMIKTTQQDGQWIIIDNKRDPHNVTKKNLRADLSAAENTSYEYHDFCANGFKLRTSSASRNPNNEIVLYLAFAESPFKNSRAR